VKSSKKGELSDREPDAQDKGFHQKVYNSKGENTFDGMLTWPPQMMRKKKQKEASPAKPI